MKIWAIRIVKSKTMLFGFALSILGVIQSQADFISTILTPHQFGYVMLGIGIAVKVLRLATDGPLEDK